MTRQLVVLRRLHFALCTLHSALHRAALLALPLALGTACDRPSALLPVSLPNLDGLPAAAQQQLRSQYATATENAASVNAIGLEYGRLGQLLFTYDLLDAAEPAFQNAQALAPTEARWSYYLGMLYRQRGDLQRAAEQFQDVVQRDGTDALARLRLAEAHLELGDTDAAAAGLQEIVRADPGNAFAHFLLGQIALEGEAYDSALVHFLTVIDIQPAATQVHVPLGMVYRNLGDSARSQYHFARRGQTLVQLQDPRVLELEALKRASGATALTQGQRLIDARRYAEALALLEDAVSHDPTNPSVYLSLGVARSHLGDQAGAMDAFEQAVRIDPAGSKAHYNMGVLLAAAGERAEAEKQFLAAITNDSLHRNAHLELAELLRRTGRCGEAVEHFAITLRLTPGDIAARQHLALCYLKLGRDRAARAVLEEGLAANTRHVGFMDALARILAASGDAGVRDGTRAVQLAEEALAIQRRTETLETVAMAYAEVGRFEEAASTQHEAIRSAERRRQAAYVQHLQQNLRRYQRRTPCRTPWPPFVYEL